MGRPGGRAGRVGLGREGSVWALGIQMEVPRAANVMGLAFRRQRAGARSPGDRGEITAGES